MLWGGRWERGSCLGTHVRIKDFKIKKNKKLKLKKIKNELEFKKLNNAYLRFSKFDLWYITEKIFRIYLNHPGRYFVMKKLILSKALQVACIRFHIL